MTAGGHARNLSIRYRLTVIISWGFTLVPVRSASQANEVAKYDYR